MKSLYFQKDDVNQWRYTPEANEVDQKVGGVLKPIFDDFVSRGFNPREIAHIMQGAVTDLELMAVLSVSDRNKKKAASDA